MNAFAQLALFLSSYSPLFVVFALLNSFGGGFSSWLCLALAAIGLGLLVVLYKVARRFSPSDLNVTSSQVRDGDAIAYIATYLVPFAAVAVTTPRERGALGLFVLLIAVYINPILALVGYRLFQVTTPMGTSVVLLTRKRFLQSNITLSARRLSDYVYWEV
jgi:hypothetical protein